MPDEELIFPFVNYISVSPILRHLVL